MPRRGEKKTMHQRYFNTNTIQTKYHPIFYNFSLTKKGVFTLFHFVISPNMTLALLLNNSLFID